MRFWRSQFCNGWRARRDSNSRPLPSEGSSLGLRWVAAVCAFVEKCRVYEEIRLNIFAVA
jgi:hypothetical protein